MRSLLLNATKTSLHALDEQREGRGKNTKIERAALHALLSDYDLMVARLRAEGVTVEQKES